MTDINDAIKTAIGSIATAAMLLGFKFGAGELCKAALCDTL